MWIRALLFSLWALLGTNVAAFAQATFNTPQVRAELTWQAPQGAEPGQTMHLGLVLQHQKDWHTYWLNPGDSGLPTAFEWQLPVGVSMGETLWPIPRKLKLGDLVNYGFEGRVALVAPLQFNAAFKAPADQTLPIALTAHWLVCRTECIPQSGTFNISIPLQAAQNRIDPDIQTTLAQQPLPFPGKVSAKLEQGRLVLQARGWPAESLGQRVALYPEQNEVIAAPAELHPRALTGWQGDVWQARLPLSDLRSTTPQNLNWWWVVGEGERARAWRVQTPVEGVWPPLPVPGQNTAAEPEPYTVAGVDLGWWGALIGAFMGGLLLNLMPCVLPVLALKMFALAQGHETPAMRRAQGWAYTAGVLLFLVGLGAGLMVLRAAGEAVGWGFQLQSPWVVGALAVLFALIALSLLDLIHFDRLLPSVLGQWQARHPALDAFFTGLLSVVVAAPCSAPFMGASLGLAVTLPFGQAMAVFTALGIGLAAPYLLASHFPALVRLVPRPGAWMNRLRHLLAIPMVATVVWLLWVLAQQVTAPDPAKQATVAMARVDSPAGEWLAWSPQVVEEAQAQGRTVFVDFTAAWCITCQVNKRTTLERAEVLSAFKEKNVLALRADWTRYDPTITQALADLDRTGIPVYAVYRQGKPPVVLSELISVADVMAVLK
jgi:thiol:disulfide interchange protein DsbD